MLYRTNAASGIQPDQITYFASSVFWRAAATDWRNHGQRIDMGLHEERFRRYLLSEESFPGNSALRVIISSPAVAKLLALLPMPDRINGMRCYTLLIPGVMLTLILAKHVPRELTNITPSPSPIM